MSNWQCRNEGATEGWRDGVTEERIDEGARLACDLAPERAEEGLVPPNGTP